ncbi:MAG TPA: hypothetical protein VE136_00785 [Anaerolineales bacterium]|nr:hypothetical protein [Anaerolineales bacterium]
MADSGDFPSFDDFFVDIQDLNTSSGQSQNARGVYVAGVFALPVIQQPEDKPAYVSNRPDLLTQFQSASRYGVTGLLAHNYLSGKEFYNLGLGQEVQVIYDDGTIGSYRVSNIERFQKLVPSSSRSHYIELDTGNELTTEQVFRKFYRGSGRVTFQTCLEGNGILNWGLLFVVAEPTS